VHIWTQSSLAREIDVRGDCSIRVGGVGFTPEQIAAALEARGLLSIELDLSSESECHCEACALERRPVLSFDEIRGLLDQATALGARRCIVVDSAPQSHPRLRDLVDELFGRNVEIELFTDGIDLTPDFATFLRARNVAVVLRLDPLTMKSDAIDALRQAGYGAASAPRLAVRVAIRPDNIAALPTLWRRMRSAGIEPYVQIITPRSSAIAPSPGTPGEGWGEGDFELPAALSSTKSPSPMPSPGTPGEGQVGGQSAESQSELQRHFKITPPPPPPSPGVPGEGARADCQGLLRVTRSALQTMVSPQRIRQLFEQLGRIDREEFGRSWEHPPELTGRSCKRHLFACHVTPCGTIFACVGVTIPLGNIRTERLRTILDESEVLENLRAFGQKVKEPCRTCSRTTDCYGCRGSAYQLTGDYLAGDQLCWKAEGTPIPSLPVAIGAMIPHGPAIRMVDRIVAVGEREARLEFVVRSDSLFVDSQGRLDETAFIEMIAQSFAASHGFHLSADEQALHRGMLLGVKDLRIAEMARVGDRLTIHVKKVARFGDFGVVEGTIYRDDGTLLAGGEIKVWRPSTP
jgi:radical SAM protein with 4Fe4S-binding SPASM domain